MSNSYFLSPSDDKWQSILERADHDFYHLPGYVALEAEWMKETPLAFCFEHGNDAMLLPLIERSLPVGSGTDAVTPYGYSGPVFTRGITDQFRLQALQAFQDSAYRRGVVSTFIRLHSKIEPDFINIEKIQGGVWLKKDKGLTVDLPLDLENEAWLSSIANGHRQDIRRTAANGALFVLDTSQIEACFPQLYGQNMRRINAGPAYQYTSYYFERLKEALGDKLHYAAALDKQGEVMCAAIFTLVDGLMQYHLSATDVRFVKFSPMKFVIYHMRHWAREHGVRFFHLGGGLGGAKDSLFEFKAKFRGNEYPFKTISVIHDLEKYKQICAIQFHEKNYALDTSEAFFPAYRRPKKAQQFDNKLNILILTAGRRVELVRAFIAEIQGRKLNARVICGDLTPELSSACVIADKAIKLPHVLSDDYIQILLSVCISENVGMVIPTTDTELILLSKNRESFAVEGVQVVISDEELVRQCRDKRLTVSLVEKIGISSPKIYDPSDLNFPCFVKPFDGSSGVGAFLLRGPMQVTTEMLEDKRLMFMEYFSEGYEEYSVDVYFDRRGRMRCLVPRLRIEIRAGEVSKSVTRRGFIYEFLRSKLFKLPGARGCLTFQFFYDRKSGRIIAIEINPRFGGGFPLSYNAGANYPGWLIDEYLLNLDVPYKDDWENNLMMLRYDAQVLVHGFN